MITRYPDDLLVLVGQLLEEALLSMAKSVMVEVGHIAGQHQHLTTGGQWAMLNILAVIVNLQVKIRRELN